MSNEDIFLAKSITERAHDLEDMYRPYMVGLDEDVLLKEMEIQNKTSNIIWEAFMVVKLEEMEEEFKITIPFKEKVMTIAEKRMEEMLGKGKRD